MTSPTVVFSCIILALLKTNIHHTVTIQNISELTWHIQSPTQKDQKEMRLRVNLLNKSGRTTNLNLLKISKTTKNTDFISQCWKIFIIDAATKTSQLAIRKQARQIKGGNSVIIVLIMVKAFQFSEINLTYRMLPFFRLNRTGYII